MKTLKIVWIALGFCSLMGISSIAQNQPKKTNKPSREIQQKLIEKLPGTWRLKTAYDGKQDVTPPDSVGEQYVFDFEGRYKNTVGAELVGEGAYRLSESAGLLYLDNEKTAPKAKVSNQETWKITIAGNVLTLQGTGTKEAKRFKYVFERTKNETTSAENN
jgi:hypothetical protein